ncbi:MAG: phosphoribosylanthranilate isomerase [Muribaculaceae bacterium]|jgi:phosphoribosylanthranilate isomerase|nr:phosphoribosylanthranilate isomerase [Muribaculaceae bacterium]
MNNNNTPLNADMMIKVCGNCRADNIRDVAALYPMMMGFIFWRGSKRYAGDLDADVIKNLPSYIRPVAVFVDATHDTIMDTVRRYGFKIVQLHGEESPRECKRLKDEGLVVFKAIGVDSEEDFELLEKYEGTVDMFLFDKKSKGYGGTGRKFNHKLLANYKLDIPYLLSGGIAPSDAPEIVNNLYTGMAGIDINSKFESEPGVKDIKLLTNFILELRKHNEHEPTGIPVWEKTK